MDAALKHIPSIEEKNGISTRDIASIIEDNK
jgi:hypothetical protein